MSEIRNARCLRLQGQSPQYADPQVAPLRRSLTVGGQFTSCFALLAKFRIEMAIEAKRKFVEILRTGVVSELSSNSWYREFQERWTVASGKNRVSGESGKAMKP